MWWLAIIISYAFINLFYPVVIVTNEYFVGFEILPGDLLANTNMNRFGCVVTSIVLFIFLPLIWLGRFIYWLFHI